MQGGAQQLSLPAGFRFHPTDEELVVHYLCRHCAGLKVDAPIIAEIDLYKFDPWQLPGMSLYGEKEWYFFSPRDRKYPNGLRPNRAAGSGYWKATGADKPVGKPKTLGIKKALVFYAGKAPRGIKTNWIMHEYRLANVDRSAVKKNNIRLDDWVLCRIYNKKGTLEKHHNGNLDREETVQFSDIEEQKPNVNAFTSNNGIATAAPLMVQVPTASRRIKHELHSDSSRSEHVLSSEFKKVESEAKWSEFDKVPDFQLNYMNMNGFHVDPFASQMDYNNQMSLFQHMFGYVQKPI